MKKKYLGFKSLVDWVAQEMEDKVQWAKKAFF